MNHSLSTTSELYARGANALRRCHDTCAGLFRGMVAAAVERVNPHMVGLEAKYQANSPVVHSVMIAAAIGGFYCSPWSTLTSVALAVPSLYVGYRFNAPTETMTAVAVNRPATNAPIPPGLVTTSLQMLPCAVSEETENLLARLMPVFISVLQVALELRDTARDKAASSLKVIATLEGRADRQSTEGKQRRLAMKQLLTDKHFMTLAARRQVSGQVPVAGGVADYNQLARLFLWAAECANFDRHLLDSAELAVWLLNELLETPNGLSPEAHNDRLNALLAEDRTDVIRQFAINILGNGSSPASSE